MRSLPAASAWLFAVVVVTLAWTGFANGGFDPPAWGWVALGLGAIGLVGALLRTDVRCSVLQAVFVGGLVLLTAWATVSLAWTSDRTLGVQDVLRDLVYIAAAVTAVLLGARTATTRLLDAVMVAGSIVTAYSLATRFFPDRLGVYSNPLGPGRLFNPLGYWNGQGMLAVITLLLLAGVATSRRRPILRAAAAAVMPIAALDLLFTLSRGSVLALGVGVVAWLAIDPNRLRTSAWLWVCVPWTLVAVWHTDAARTLFGSKYGLVSASTGHRLAWQVLLLAAFAAAAVYLAAFVEGRWHPSMTVRRVYIGSQVGVLIAAAVVAVSVYGTPPQMAHSLRQALEGPSTQAQDPARLLSLSLDDRSPIWRAAWDDARAHPLRGSGIGSFQQYWYEHRSVAADTDAAHSAYLEAFAELGIVGLVVLTATLIAPLMAGIRARRHPAVPAAVGVYVAYLFHTGIDWDWLLPALTMAALFTACALLSADTEPQPALHRSSQWILAGTGVVVAVIATFGLLGNRDLSAADAAAGRGDFRAAAAEARSAARWQPWSYLPWLTIASAERAQDDANAAEQAYRTAIRRDGGNWDAWFGLATISSGHSRLESLRTARRLNPLSTQIAVFCLHDPEPGCDGLSQLRDSAKTGPG